MSGDPKLSTAMRAAWERDDLRYLCVGKNNTGLGKWWKRRVYRIVRQYLRRECRAQEDV